MNTKVNTVNVTPFLTDFYEFTMLQSALNDNTAHKPAVFELFARKLPHGRRYGVVAGTERAIQAVENFTFDNNQIAWLRDNTELNENTLNYLRNFKFSGNIYGYHEGDLYFPYSPILTVEATFGECVLLETVLLSIMNHDSAIASAASRMVQSASGKSIIEMGSRRCHEKGAVDAARASYISGFDATSNVEASFQYGVPITGTSAHAFTLAHETEEDAFKNQVETLGGSTTLLVDTYNISDGITNAMKASYNLGGIRIDSGDLGEETIKAREQLDDNGFHNTKIVLSSDIDEFVIQDLVERNIPVDSIGAGTKVVTGSGHPTAGMVYKLVEIDGRSVSKKSENKVSIGGKKKAYRNYTDKSESIVVDNADFENGKNDVILIKDFIVNGETVFKPSTHDARNYHADVMKKFTKDEKSILSDKHMITTKYVVNNIGDDKND